eukprot:scaffold19410_cov53-Phaeocystis_antarctica.AAC.3
MGGAPRATPQALPLQPHLHVVPRAPPRLPEHLVRGLHRLEALGRLLRVDTVALGGVRVEAEREQPVLPLELRLSEVAGHAQHRIM